MLKNNYEDLKIGQTVNVINPEQFPQDYPLHWHKYTEVIAFPQNEEYSQNPLILLGQTLYTLEPGDILLIWPGEPHEILSNNRRQLMGFQFPMTLLNEIPDFAPYLNLIRGLKHIKASERPELSDKLSAYISCIYEIEKKDTLFPNTEKIINLYGMFMELCNQVHLQVSPITDRTLEKIDLACQYIQDNCDKDISLDTAAKQIGFSACYFSRLFKQTTHYSFVDYLNLQRIRRAQQMLIDSDMNVTEVSYCSGFKSISSFNRVFRQCRGCSPSEYRKYYTEESR